MGLAAIAQKNIARRVVARHLGLYLLETFLLEFCYEELYYFFVFGWRCNHASLPVDKFGFANKDSEKSLHQPTQTQANTNTLPCNHVHHCVFLRNKLSDNIYASGHKNWLPKGMQEFLNNWAEAAYTSVGFFWMAVWAFILGYIISSLIAIFVTEKRMQETMGQNEGKGVLLGTFFGFISSSCSFSALATTKTLFQKGASFVASIAFLLASTNLVIELGIIIAIFMGWQFVVGEYVGGVLLILGSWLLIRLINPTKLIKQAKENLDDEHEMKPDKRTFAQKIKSIDSWAKVGKQYGMEWKMVWKDVTVGFTIAGIVAAFVPDAFFRSLFINSGQAQQELGFFTVLQHVIVGPVAAFFTFIGSMGNIPLAALLFGKGVSFAGVMAFIFSDLVVFPVLRINAKYYGWKMALFILFLLFASLVATSLILHYGLFALDMLPDASSTQIMNEEHFKLNYTFYLNIAFLAISGILVYLGFFKGKDVMHHKPMAPKSMLMENVLKYLTLACYLWLAGGLILKYAIL